MRTRVREAGKRKLTKTTKGKKKGVGGAGGSLSSDAGKVDLFGSGAVKVNLFKR